LKIKILILAFLVNSVLGAPISAKAETTINHLFFRELSRALYERDETKLKNLVAPSVEIPEMRENTPIGGLATLPSPHKNKVVMIGHFRDECLDDVPWQMRRKDRFYMGSFHQE
jgi:hypothetical protein